MYFYAEQTGRCGEDEDALLRFDEEQERDSWVEVTNMMAEALFPDGVARPVTEEDVRREGVYDLAMFSSDDACYPVVAWDAEMICPISAYGEDAR